jgi:REP element-mobilizing transposase RayT
MPRPLRIEFLGALYHVVSRGNNRGRIFWDETDRTCFLEALARVVTREAYELHAYCLMGNHYHLVLATPLGNLARGMQQLNSDFARQLNRRYARSGHVFQGRYQARLAEHERHVLELARYVVLNPVRAGLVRRPAAWRWSSYRATAGIDPAPPFLATDWLLGHFGGEPRAARRGYERFVEDGLDRPGAPVLAPAA